MNYVYYNAMEKVKDNAFLLMQYGEFLEEMSEYEAAREVFRKAYAITPTDDIARSIVRVGLSKDKTLIIIIILILILFKLIDRCVLNAMIWTVLRVFWMC